MSSKEISKGETIGAAVELTKADVTPDKLKRMPRSRDNKLYCSKCRRYRAKKHFSKNKASRDGYHGWCRDCASEYSKAYRARKQAKPAEDKQ